MAEVNRAWKEMSNDARKNYIVTNEFVLDDNIGDERAPLASIENIEKPKKRPRLEQLKTPVRKPEAQLIELDENEENSVSNHQVLIVHTIVGILNSELLVNCHFISILDHSEGGKTKISIQIY